MGNPLPTWLTDLLSSGDISQDAAQLRQKANSLFTEAKSLSAQSQEAFQAGDKATAKQLSEKKNQLFAEAEAMNEKAMRQTLKERNEGRGLNVIDLHGLFVQEAVTAVHERIAECGRQRPLVQSLVVITGRGLHSENHVAKIKPRMIEFAQEMNINCEVGVPNDGCLTFDLSGTTTLPPLKQDTKPLKQKPTQPQLPQQKPVHIPPAVSYPSQLPPSHQYPPPQPAPPQQTGEEEPLLLRIIKGLIGCLCTNKSS